MYRTGLRAGWFGDVGMYGYMGRAGEAAGRVQEYMRGPDDAYNLSQASLWQARQAYWQAQQQWAPVAEAWGGARLASFMFPQFGLVRAFGFPFYSAGQRLTAAAAMAPYVRQALAQDPTALSRIEQSSIFWPGRYETLPAALLGGVGEWTAAQSLIWTIRGSGFNLGTMKQTAAIQLMQAGLSLMIDPLATMAGRAIMGLPPIPPSRQQQLEMGGEFAIGAGLFGGGVLAGRTWGFVPQLTTAVGAAYTPFSIQEAVSLQQFFTPERVLWAPQRGVYNAFLPTREVLGGPQVWVQRAWNEAVDYPNVGVWGQRFSRLAALGRVIGSIIGGQIGFELGAGLGTAFVDALARQGRDVGFVRAVASPITGTAGLMIGSWAMAGPLAAELPFAAPMYVGYKFLQAGVQPIPGVTYPVDQQYARYPSAAGTQAYTWSLQKAVAGVQQFGQNVWSTVQGARFGPPQNIYETTIAYRDNLAMAGQVGWGWAPQYERPSTRITPYEYYQMSGLNAILRQTGDLAGGGISWWQRTMGGYGAQYERPSISAPTIQQEMMRQQAVGYYGTVGETARERREFGGWGGVTPPYPAVTAENMWAGLDYRTGAQWGSATSFMAWAATHPGAGYYDPLQQRYFEITPAGQVISHAATQQGRVVERLVGMGYNQAAAESAYQAGYGNYPALTAAQRAELDAGINLFGKGGFKRIGEYIYSIFGGEPRYAPRGTYSDYLYGQAYGNWIASGMIPSMKPDRSVSTGGGYSDYVAREWYHSGPPPFGRWAGIQGPTEPYWYAGYGKPRVTMGAPGGLGAAPEWKAYSQTYGDWAGNVTKWYAKKYGISEHEAAKVATRYSDYQNRGGSGSGSYSWAEAQRDWVEKYVMSQGIYAWLPELQTIAEQAELDMIKDEAIYLATRDTFDLTSDRLSRLLAERG